MAAFGGSAPATPAVLEGPLCADLAGAAIPLPTSNAWHRVGAPVVGAFSRVFPATVHSQRVGARAPGHDAQWFDRIHVVPRRVNLAFVLSEQEIAVEVWNAFMSASKQLTAINVTGPAGVTVDNPDTLPVVQAASRSRIYQVNVLSSGDPTVDNRVTWVFTGISTSGTDLLIVGSRVVPWPFEANDGDTIAESIEYLTDVITSRNRTEQRVKLRELARRGMEFAVILDERAAQHANALLHNWQPRAFGVPYWQFANRLTAAASIGAPSIMVDTTDVPWDELTTVFLWKDPFTWEALTVDSVTPTQINLASLPQKSWAAGSTLVMPLAVGRMPEEQAFTWDDLRAGQVRVAFAIEAA